MELGVHLPQIRFGDEELSLRRVQAAVDVARTCGFAAVCANDHFVFQAPWLDGMTALASADYGLSNERVQHQRRAGDSARLARDVVLVARLPDPDRRLRLGRHSLQIVEPVHLLGARTGDEQRREETAKRRRPDPSPSARPDSASRTPGA